MASRAAVSPTVRLRGPRSGRVMKVTRPVPAASTRIPAFACHKTRSNLGRLSFRATGPARNIATTELRTELTERTAHYSRVLVTKGLRRGSHRHGRIGFIKRPGPGLRGATGPICRRALYGGAFSCPRRHRSGGFAAIYLDGRIF